MRRKIILLFLIVAFICGLSIGVGYSGWFKKMFGEGYHMGRFLLGDDTFEVRLGDYETRIFILIETPLKRKFLKSYVSADYKFSVRTWKDFVTDVDRIDKRIDEKLKEIRPDK